MSRRDMSKNGKSRWIPWAFVGALGLVVGVNGALAYFATATAPGLVTQHPFERGNDYNRVLDAAAAQDALGWHASLRFDAAVTGRGALVAELSDRAGQPLRGLAVTARLTRPLGPQPEIALTLAEVAPGRYVQTISLDQPGQWDVLIAAQGGAGPFFLTKRIVVK
jgi:nitrogen fixation protein FixH